MGYLKSFRAIDSAAQCKSVAGTAELWRDERFLYYYTRNLTEKLFARGRPVDRARGRRIRERKKHVRASAPAVYRWPVVIIDYRKRA